MNLNKFLIAAFSIILLFSCQNQGIDSKQTKSETKTDSSTNILSHAQSSAITLDTIKNFEGKKLKENGLFEKFRIISRIEKLLGKEFTYFEQAWEEETPLKKDINVMYSTACNKDNCKSLKALIVLDYTTNEINVYLFNNGKIKTFEETNIIGFSETLAAQYEKLRDSQNK